MKDKTKLDYAAGLWVFYLRIFFNRLLYALFGAGLNAHFYNYDCISDGFQT